MTASRDDALAAVRIIGDYVLEQALSAPDRSPTWGRGFDLERRPATDVGIFNGRAGDALFLAALYSRTGDHRLRDVAARVFAATCDAIPDRDSAVRLLGHIGLGLTGGGSLIYALVRSSEWLETPAFLDAARVLASAITEDVVAGDRKLDVTWGSAGAIPGLLVLGGGTRDEALRSAVWCAEHLLAHRILDGNTGRHAWGPSPTAPHSGFAHGTTGIAHSLLRLYEHVPDSRYRDAVLDGFRFERSLYVPSANDWLDYSGQPVAELMSSWCHGAAGIGLSRLAALGVIAPEDRHDAMLEVGRAVAKVTSSGLPGLSTLCCGSMGRIELVLAAGLILCNEELIAQARVMATGAVSAIRQRGYRAVDGADERTPFGPGLWHGAAGIGYTLLRVWDPDSIPSVLMMR